LALSLAAAQDAAGDWRGAMALYAKLATDKDADIRSRALDAVGDSYSRRGLVEQAVEAYIEAARARGQAAILGSSRYKAVYNAADALVMAHVSQAWQGFEEIASGRQVITRESVLAALNAAAAQLSRALGLCDEALPPPDLADEHHQRQLYYALLREAVMAAVTYVDTGRADMVPIATERMRQAMEKQPAKEIR
jgi:tetratricopeptide (TPR) repeat protein